MQPRTKAEVHTYLGMSGYYRSNIKNYAKKTAGLRELIKVSTKFPKEGLSEEHKKEIELTKRWLTSEPILAHPRFYLPFRVNTNACYKGLGATLT
jgi:hypothetical protein